MKSGQPAEDRRSSSGVIAGTVISKFTPRPRGASSGARDPVSTDADLLEHDARRSQLKTGEALLRPVVENFKTQSVTQKLEARGEVGDQQFGTRPGDSRVASSADEFISAHLSVGPQIVEGSEVSLTLPRDCLR